MSKQQLIAAIRQHNPSAGDGFLTAFGEGELSHYLSHLTYSRRPRGPKSFWVRRTHAPAVVGRVR